MASLSGPGTACPLPGLRGRCSRIKTPHQRLWETGNYYMHIVFLQSWHTLVHRPASPCIFFLQRRSVGGRGRKHPDKNKFCSRSFCSLCFSDQVSFISHHLVQFVTSTFCTTAVWPFGLSLLFFPPIVAHILHLRKRAPAKCANCFHIYACQHFSELPHPPPHSVCDYCLFCCFKLFILHQ